MAEYQLVDVFTGDGAAGNPAGVVPRADGLAEAEMQRIATALGVSDTAFLFHEGGLRLRWFTPACEIDLCGHATLAAAHVLGIGEETDFGYAGGTLKVRPEPIGGELLYWLARPAPAVRPLRGSAGEVLAALGNPPLDDDLPLMTTPENDLLIPLRDHHVVDRLRPDLTALGAVASAASIRGVTVLAVPGGGPYELRVRFFAPHLGIPEDPATGSVHTALLSYLHHLDVLERWPDELRAHSLQGDALSRQGLLWLRLSIDEATDTALTAEVGGQCVTRGSGNA